MIFFCLDVMEEVEGRRYLWKRIEGKMLKDFPSSFPLRKDLGKVSCRIIFSLCSKELTKALY